MVREIVHTLGPGTRRTLEWGDPVTPTSRDGGDGWSNPTLLDTPDQLAAFTPAAAVGRGGRGAVTYYRFTDQPSPKGILPVDYWLATTDGPGTGFTHYHDIAGPFNIEAASKAFGFLGDYEGLATVQNGTSFLPFFAHTNCEDRSCRAKGTPDGSPTGGPDPQDVAAWQVAP